jgi:hypothetical protein
MQVRYQLRQRPPTRSHRITALQQVRTKRPWSRPGGSSAFTLVVAPLNLTPGDPNGRDHGRLDLTATDTRTLEDATIEAHAERVRTDGWSVVENAIEPDLVDEIERRTPKVEA